MGDSDRLMAAYAAARENLLAERSARGGWTGELSSSPLSTATAISALIMHGQHGRLDGTRSTTGYDPQAIYQGDLSEQVVASLHWLAAHQNEDGGWGDTDKSQSNIATTMLVRAAFHLTGVPAKDGDLLQRADTYVEQAGGAAALRRRYGRDKTFAVPILTNCALAGLTPWRSVPPLPFELASLPATWYHHLRLPVVSYAIPALVAVGLAKFTHDPPWNPLLRYLRRKTTESGLRLLEKMQPASGGFLEAIPLTSFVVMCLASVGRANHPVCSRGIEFLLASVRPDGSWPIDTNLATWNTSLAVHALGAPAELSTDQQEQLVEELLATQQSEEHPYTNAAPGGWAWTPLPGGVPDVDDTSGALLALSRLRISASTIQQARIQTAAKQGVQWLLDIQNRDGGWPTFCRGWGTLPFDRSGCDLTAHALRALHCWRDELTASSTAIAGAIQQGLAFLEQQQHDDGSWTSLWFGNQHASDECNRVHGTSRVLLAYRDLQQLTSRPAEAGLRWLASEQQPDGGWGGGPKAVEDGFALQQSTVEETGWATEAMLAATDQKEWIAAAQQGVQWLVAAVEENRHLEPAPVGLYFARLWYYERLYPQIAATAALRTAAEKCGALAGQVAHPSSQFVQPMRA